MGTRRCEICGRQTPDVRPSLVRWNEHGPRTAGIFSTARRCTDPVACRLSLELAGEPWPLLERSELERTTPGRSGIVR